MALYLLQGYGGARSMFIDASDDAEATQTAQQDMHAEADRLGQRARGALFQITRRPGSRELNTRLVRRMNAAYDSKQAAPLGGNDDGGAR